METRQVMVLIPEVAGFKVAFASMLEDGRPAAVVLSESDLAAAKVYSRGEVMASLERAGHNTDFVSALLAM